MLAGCQLIQPAAGIREPDYWPTEGWRSSTPEEQGIDSDKLAELLLASRQQNVQVHSLLPLGVLGECLQSVGIRE